jgi:hypothetical protein
MSMSFLGQSPVNANTAIPYQRIIEPSQLGLFLNLEQSELLRIRRYHEHWRFYVGQHWKFTREDGEPLVTLNYARALIDKSVAWLVGASMAIKVPAVLDDYVGARLREVWGYNRMDQLLYNIATLGAVTGDVFILVTYAPPTAQARRVNPHTRGQIRIQVLNSEQVYPQWDPLNPDVMTAARIETIYYDDKSTTTDTSNNQDHAARQLHSRRYTQIITADEIIEKYSGQEAQRKPNPLGEIPIIHIKNHSVPGEYYGLGDMDGIIDLNREMNEKATDVSDTINYHAAPVTVITGAKVGSLERSARNIWSGLPPDAKVFNLQLEGDLGASLRYMEFVKKAMLEIAQVPEGSLGTMQPISNTSGVALHTQYQPLVEKTNRKRTFYEPGLEDVNYFVIRTLEVTDRNFKLPTDLCSTCGGKIVEFAEPNGSVTLKCYHINSQTFDFLPPDEMKLTFMRKYSFGTKATKAAYAQIFAERNKGARSYWDPEPEKVEEPAAQLPVVDDATGELMEQPPEESPVPQLESGQIDIPEEPETIRLVKRVVDPVTGNPVSEEATDVTIVPTGCEHPQYLNPYKTKTTLKDTLPKDKLLLQQLYDGWLRAEIVTREWVRDHSDIEDLEDLKRQIAEEAEKGKGPLVALAAMKQSNPFTSAQSRTEGPPFGSNLPGGNT